MLPSIIMGRLINDITERAQKAKEKAVSLYPLESWLEIEAHIFITESRQPVNKNQQRVLDKELVQARILTSRGSTVYLLPEVIDPARLGVKYPDAVVDGFIMEFKTITGSIREIEKRFKESRRKADQVFFKIDSPLVPNEVRRKLSQSIIQKGYPHGLIIAYFTETGHLQYWDVQDLK
jgi:hypothetical protein